MSKYNRIFIFNFIISTKVWSTLVNMDSWKFNYLGETIDWDDRRDRDYAQKNACYGCWAYRVGRKKTIASLCTENAAVRDIDAEAILRNSASASPDGMSSEATTLPSQQTGRMPSCCALWAQSPLQTTGRNHTIRLVSSSSLQSFPWTNPIIH